MNDPRAWRVFAIALVVFSMAAHASEDRGASRTFEQMSALHDSTGEAAQALSAFIDARKLGTMVDRVHRELTDDDLAKIAGTYHAWRGDRLSPSPLAGEGWGEGYKDIPGFCKAAKLDDIRKHGHVLTPGRYVG